MRVLALVCLVGVMACAGESGEVATETPQKAPAPESFEEQVALGQTLYGANCASCHGGSGEGSYAPRLVGIEEGALPLDPPASAKARTGQFKTVGDVAKFVVDTMPPKDPGSLDAAEYWAILAFALHANGIDLEQILDQKTADELVLHE